MSLVFLDEFLPARLEVSLNVGVVGFIVRFACCALDACSCLSSSLAAEDAAALLACITFSTILLPITICPDASPELVPTPLPLILVCIVLMELGLSDVCNRPLVTLGEHDCLLDDLFISEVFSTWVDLVKVPDPGLVRDEPLVFEVDRSGIVVLRFGGGSKENPGISDGCQSRGLAVGELPREEAVLLEGREVALLTEDDLLDATTGWLCV